LVTTSSGEVLYIHLKHSNLATLGRTLDEEFAQAALRRHQPGLEDWIVNHSEAAAQAYALVESRRIIRLDSGGQGSVRGVEMARLSSSASSGRLYVRPEAIAWLLRHFVAKGLGIVIRPVR
jgi:hypothetical protein